MGLSASLAIAASGFFPTIVIHTYQPAPIELGIAGAVITDSTFPPQCGHFFRSRAGNVLDFFRVAARTSSICNSYRGTDAPLRVLLQNSKYSTRGADAGRNAVLDSWS